jgi:hypothetical protein
VLIEERGVNVEEVGKGSGGTHRITGCSICPSLLMHRTQAAAALTYALLDRLFGDEDLDVIS